MARAFYDEVELMEVGADPALPGRTGEWRTLAAAPAEGYRAPRTTGNGGPNHRDGPAVIVTARYGAQVIAPVHERLEALAARSLRVLEVGNDFFGGNVGVSGLMVGEDVQRALAADPEPAALYLIPDVALSGDRFLDEMTLADVGQVSGAPVQAVPASAVGLVAGARL
jgi:hypothetical protein